MSDNRGDIKAVEAGAEVRVSPSLIHECNGLNEKGDGFLYSIINLGRVLYNQTSAEWLSFNGVRFESDLAGESLRLVELVALEYDIEKNRLTEQAQEARQKGESDRAKGLEALRDRLARAARRLRSHRGILNCLAMARLQEGMSCAEAELDTDPYLLACANGVVDLRTGHFRPGRAEDKITKGSSIEWRGLDAKAPKWEKFLKDIFPNRPAVIKYLQRGLGYGLTGLTVEHILIMLHGQGRNGKGVISELLLYILGDLAKPIASELLLDQKYGRSSAGPSPDIMGLKGRRVVIASETDQDRHFSTSRVKWIVGGDSLVGRWPHDKVETTFTPSHLLILLTNHLPHAHGDDAAFFARVHLLPFEVTFVNRPQGENERPCDKYIFERLKAEAPGILAWMVRGCLAWRIEGLNPPPEVLAATEQYRAAEDYIGEFIETCCEPPAETSGETRTGFKELYDGFVAWYESTLGNNPPKKQKFSNLMKRRFRRERSGGKIWFYGLALKPEYERD